MLRLEPRTCTQQNANKETTALKEEGLLGLCEYTLIGDPDLSHYANAQASFLLGFTD
jgi:hypothetical protein